MHIPTFDMTFAQVWYHGPERLRDDEEPLTQRIISWRRALAATAHRESWRCFDETELLRQQLTTYVENR